LAIEWQQDWFMENIKIPIVGLILGEENVDLHDFCPESLAPYVWGFS